MKNIPKRRENPSALKPGPWGLFETIEGFLEFTNILRMMCINIPRGLYHVYLLLKYTMKKGILNIQLFERPIELNS